MKKLISLLVITLFIQIGFGQKLHSPAEILKIMSDSKLSYQIDLLKKEIQCSDKSEKLNYHNYYRLSTDSGLYTYSYKIRNDVKPIFDKAEAFFQSQIPDSAIFYYKETLKADSSLYNVMTYIGQVYGSKKDYQNAIVWYKKAISKNFIDYMAHWFLADTYIDMNDTKNALDEITIAQILNRNNQRIRKSLTYIYEKAKLSTDDWCFNPQVEINKISDTKINVSANDKWLGYAMTKAIWSFEPGYKESMGVAPGRYSTIEDKECLITLLIGLENSKTKIKNDPQLLILKRATDKKYLDEYILYEIVLPENPQVALQLPEKTILNIKDYILNLRNEK